MHNEIVILIADDEPLITLGLQEALEKIGYTVCSGAGAVLEINLPAHDIAGLVTDIRMEPGTNGWDVGRRAREVYPGLPVVYMSGDRAADHAACGVSDSIMVQKPFADAQMLTAISKLLSPPATASHDR